MAIFFKNSILLLILCIAKPVVSAERLLLPLNFNSGLVSREVTEYTDLEQNLLALQKANPDQKNNLLAEEFETWSATSNVWQSRAEWLKSQHKAAASQDNFIIHNLSVRQIDDLSIVSFLLEKSAKRHKKPSKQFITDMWRRSTGKLLVRYQANTAYPQPLSNRLKF